MLTSYEHVRVVEMCSENELDGARNVHVPLRLASRTLVGKVQVASFRAGAKGSLAHPPQKFVDACAFAFSLLHPLPPRSSPRRKTDRRRSP